MAGTRCLLFLIILLALAVAGSRAQSSSCSRICAQLQCDSLGIRYGKFCGVGWTGCKDEEPCDDLDKCCQEHDLCVEKKGMSNVNCHETLKKCMRKVEKSGKKGFSKRCPYDVVIPLMTQAGIQPHVTGWRPMIIF